MLISEVALMTGFSKDTLRYYEKIGLIELNRNNRSSGNYRHYGKRESEKLRQLKLLKEFGFSLREIKYLFKLGESNLAKCETVSDLVDEKVLVLDAKIDQLNLMKSRLVAAQDVCKGTCTEIIDKFPDSANSPK